MSAATDVVSVYASETVVESGEPVAPSDEPPLQSRVERLMNRITTSLQGVGEQVRTASNVDGIWFQRGMEQSNFAYFEASLLPIKELLRQAVEAYLNSPDAIDARLSQQVVAHAARLNGCKAAELDAINWMLLVDECLDQAFEHRDQWRPGKDPLDWVAGFIPSAVAKFVESV